MEAWVSYWPLLVWTHSPKIQVRSLDHAWIPEKQTDGDMGQLCPHCLNHVSVNHGSHPDVQETNIWRYESAGLDSQSKSPRMWAWSDNHTQDVQKTNRWRCESAIGHRWSGLTVQTSKDVSMIYSDVQKSNRWRYESAVCHRSIN